jgi:hypothetical protein
MGTASKNQQVIRLKILAVVLGVLLITSTILLIKEASGVKPFAYVGGPIEVAKSNQYVENYTDGVFVFDGSTTSFLLEKNLLDSFSNNPQGQAPTYYRIFFARNEDDKKTLVITGAYLDTAAKRIVNTHIQGGYDIEHVFPIDDIGNVYEIVGHQKKKVWVADRFPN